MKDYNEMTNEELIEIKNNINAVLEQREDKKKEEAIEKFRIAFEEVKELFYEIYVGNLYAMEPCHYIQSFDEFHFKD